jgi:2-polyprenyl-3-methyl-5-hydroxy-6-metoxy-1,4-benzoquinol methylase
MRNYDNEFSDGQRKYEYNIDNILKKYMLRAFSPFMSKGKALELGCYKGEFTEILAHNYQDLTVVEASKDLVTYTQKRLGAKVKFINSTFELLELDEKYDAIFLMHTLEHLDDPVHVLQKINSWLSEEGRLFLVVPNGNAPSRQIAVKMGLIPYNTAVTEAEKSHGHRITYTFDTLEREANSAGLNILHRGGILFKALANFQFDRMLEEKIIDENYLEGCYKLGLEYPNLCASIYLICEKGND